MEQEHTIVVKYNRFGSPDSDTAYFSSEEEANQFVLELPENYEANIEIF